MLSTSHAEEVGVHVRAGADAAGVSGFRASGFRGLGFGVRVHLLLNTTIAR